MEPEEPPPTLKNAGDVVFPDVMATLPEQLIAMTALAWILLAPVWIGVAARRRQGRRAVLIYSGGTVLAALVFTFQSGMIGEPVAHRIGVWAQHIWLPLFGVALVLSLIAIFVGHMIGRRWPAVL